MRRGNKYPPYRCDIINSVVLWLQYDVIIVPNEFKKVDLDIKIFSKNYRPVELKPRLSTSLQYSVQISTGLIDTGYTEYLQIGVHNASNAWTLLPSGTLICEIFALDYPTCTVEEFEAEFDNHGGDLSPYNLYIERLQDYVDYDKVAFEKLKEKLDKYPIEIVELKEMKLNCATCNQF
jgi:dUTPase